MPNDPSAQNTSLPAFKVIADASPEFAIYVYAYDERAAFFEALDQLPAGVPVKRIEPSDIAS